MIKVGCIYKLKYTDSIDSYLFNHEVVKVIEITNNYVHVKRQSGNGRTLFVHKNELHTVDYIARNPINKPEITNG